MYIDEMRRLFLFIEENRLHVSKFLFLFSYLVNVYFMVRARWGSLLCIHVLQMVEAMAFLRNDVFFDIYL